MVPLVDQIAGILTQVFMEGAKDRAFSPREMDDIAKDIIERVLADRRDTTEKRISTLEKRVAELDTYLNQLRYNTYPYTGWLTFCSSQKVKVNPDGTMTYTSQE